MDEWLFEQVNQFAIATPWLHPVIVGYATYGVVLFAALLLAGWWSARRARQPRKMAAALLAGVSILAAVAVNQPIVAMVHEARPYTTHTGILVLAHRSGDLSFPSDHATMAGAAAAGLWLVSRRLGLVTTIAALAMSFARVYIAAHYPQDVAAGLLLGAAVAMTVYLPARTLTTRLVIAVGRTPLRPLAQHRRHTTPWRAHGCEQGPPGDAIVARSRNQPNGP
ncbi:phosphatase PAP2 family protein [Micromonospora deserti]|uniref:UDP-diphosphatase n=1 Tax=Micromonospora deserti TaxID=2070366 RepID=A0A2W2EDX0_9ACTN|nr:phosphatase PAP2 family protein [Micromonospora deserti]PZG02954.1 UDP-diphosphatase [Micromonospora deserti]